MPIDPDKPDAPSADVTLAETLLLLKRWIALDLRVCAPATVAAYNAATSTATVVLGQLPVALTRQGAEVPQPPITLPSVPVAWAGSLVAHDTAPLPPGSTGLVLFSDRSLQQWLTSGTPGDPLLPNAHELADGVFLPLRLGVSAVTPTNPAARVIEAPLLQLGEGATHPVLHGDALLTAFGTFTGALLAASQLVTGTPGSPLPPDPTGVTAWAFAEAVGIAATALATTFAGWPSARVTTV